MEQLVRTARITAAAIDELHLADILRPTERAIDWSEPLGPIARLPRRSPWAMPGELLRMSLNKKQKKQLDLDHKRLQQLQLQLAGAKLQLDDPDEVTRLQHEIAACQARIEKLKAEA